MTHTKGPWKTEELQTERYGMDDALTMNVIGGNDEHVCTMVIQGPYIDNVSDSEAYKNTALVCAAPEMLAALEHINVELCDGDYVKHSNNALRKVRDAIKLARGLR